MKNKVLIKLTVPEINESYDVFIPVNEIMWKIKKLILKCVSDLTDGAIDMTREFILINKSSGRIYNNNDIILNTEIRNGTEIILLSKERGAININRIIKK